MALETATYISGLINTNPTATDPKSQGDDHIRLIKATLLTTFPGITGALTPTHTQLNQQVAAVAVNAAAAAASIAVNAAGNVSIGLSGAPDRLNVGGNFALVSDAIVTTPQISWRASDNSIRAYMSMATQTAGLVTDEHRFFQQYGFKTFYTNALERLRIDVNGHSYPGADNTQTLGSASNRWSVVYAGTGSINTSDARQKTTVSAMTAPELAAARELAREIGTYKWLDAVAEKGSGARVHVGLTVQRAVAIMQANGLDPMKYAFLCYDAWPRTEEKTPDIRDESGKLVAKARTVVKDAGDRYSFRHDQLALFIARGQEARIAALEAR